MKLSFLDFLASGPDDAVWSEDWGRIRSKTHKLLLVVHKHAGSSVVSQANWRTDGGCPHNPFGPACIWIYPCGSTRILSYHIDGMAHRADGPAIIEYDQRGNIIRQQHIVNPFVLSRK